MAYVAYCKALYDYAAQAADELTLAEDDVLYVLENDDAEWWKAKVRNPDAPEGEEDKVGLVPANYVEEAPPLRLSRALYDYAATSDEELTVAEDELLRVYEADGPWLLVQKHADGGLDQGTGKLGFVPANYVDEVEAADAQEQAGIVPDPEEAIEEAEQEAAATAAAAAAAAAVPSIPAAATASSTIPADKADDIRMWPVQILDAKKKKKKGTLGLGNASLFFASESDKAPVQRVNVVHIVSHNLEKGKQLHIELSEEAGIEENALHFVIGSSKDAEEIVDKLETSVLIARSRPASSSAAAAASPRQPRSVPPAARPAGTPLPPPPPLAPLASVTPATATSHTSTALPAPARKTVSFSAPKPAAAPALKGEPAIALYDFTAEGDDELSVAENEDLFILERENEDWWKVRNQAGQEGVVPASYVEAKNGASTDAGDQGEDEGEEEDDDEEAAAAEAAAVAAAADEAEREERAQRMAEQRKQEAATRKKREDAERQRRDVLKAQPAPAPPQADSRAARNTDSARAAAKDVQIPKGRSQPDRPKDAAGGATSSRGRPDPYKTRIWQDVSGKFNVEAQFLQLTGGKVRLHKINGVVIDVPVEKMSKPDIQYLEEVTGKRLLPSRSNGTSSSSRRTAGGGADDSLAAAAEQRRKESSQRDSEHRRQKEQEQRYREREREKQRQAGGDGSGNGSAGKTAAARTTRKNVDWFEFFLAAGVDVDDCTRYSTAFERDKIDESLLPDMEAGVLRSLGLREGDIIRVVKFIEKKYGSVAKTAAASSSSAAPKRNGSSGPEKQMKADEDLARKLQEQETAARRGETTSPPPNLFSGPDGSLKTTRRGRPNTTPKTSAVVGSIDASSLSAVRDAAATPPSRMRSPEMIQNMKRDAASAASRPSGFDDDAWTPRPPSTKPATPAAGARSSSALGAGAGAAKPATPAPVVAPPAPTPPPAPPVAAAAAAPSPAPAAAAPANPNSALFEKLAAMRPSSASAHSPGPGASPSPGFGMGMGMGMGYMNPNAPRGPLAPVPANQGLLAPLISTGGSGGFIPTRTGAGGSGLTPMMTGMNMGGFGGGMQPQQAQMTGWQGGAGSGMMMSQPTGFNNGGMGMGMGMGAMPTGMGGMGMMGGGVSAPASGFSGAGMMTTSSGFAGISAPAPQQQQQQQQQQNGSSATTSGGADKFSAANVFAQMKAGQFGQDAAKDAQPAGRYDALRPQPTGFQPGGIISQPTGFAQNPMQQMQQPQQQQQQYGMGMGMGPMGMQMTGFPGQQQGFPQQQQQQQQYPGFGQGGSGFGYQQY